MIESVFYSEFDNTVGPKIVYQHPEGTLSAELFDSVSEHIIAKPQLCGRLSTVTISKFRTIGFPMCIEDRKYPRNALLFNMAFVLALGDNPRDSVVLYAPVVRKLAFFLRQLELESEFLFRENTKTKLKYVIEQIYSDLNARGECAIPIDSNNTLYLRLIPSTLLDSTDTVQEHEVPVRIVEDLDDKLHDSECDLTILRILPFIDGVNYVKRVADLADVDVDVVKRCMQHLLFWRAIKMIDIFQFSNRYRVDHSHIQALYAIQLHSPEAQLEILRYVTLPDCIPPSFSVIFALYCAFDGSHTVKEFYQLHSLQSLNVDVRRLVTYGVINGFLRRMHTYIMRTNDHVLSMSKDDGGRLIPQQVKLMLLEECHCYDSFCCLLFWSKEELDAFVTEQSYSLIYL